MPYLVLHRVLTFFLDLIQVLIRSKQDQAVEILLLQCWMSTKTAGGDN